MSQFHIFREKPVSKDGIWLNFSQNSQSTNPVFEWAAYPHLVPLTYPAGTATGVNRHASLPAYYLPLWNPSLPLKQHVPSPFITPPPPQIKTIPDDSSMLWVHLLILLSRSHKRTTPPPTRVYSHAWTLNAHTSSQSALRSVLRNKFSPREPSHVPYFYTFLSPLLT